VCWDGSKGKDENLRIPTLGVHDALNIRVPVHQSLLCQSGHLSINAVRYNASVLCTPVGGNCEGGGKVPLTWKLEWSGVWQAEILRRAQDERLLTQSA